MTKNSATSRPPVYKLTAVGKPSQEQAKLISLKRPEQKPRILLPPPQEKYIKAKQHDFL